MTKLNLQFWVACAVFLSYLSMTSSSQAQTTPRQAQIIGDGTLSTKVETSNNLSFTITGGKQVGDSLFHSFKKFSVPKEGEAVFNFNETQVHNVFSRVTGNTTSRIDGSIKAPGQANLLFINPNGIIFNSDAQLKIGGSFIASTATQINFANGNIFSATDPQVESLLTVSTPVGLQLGEKPGSIINRSVVEKLGLQVQPKKTLAFVGGNVFLDGGRLYAPGGRIELGSLAENSLASLTSVTEGWSLGYDGVQSFRDIRLSKMALINTSRLGKSSGDILLQGRHIGINNSFITAINKGVSKGGMISLKASNSIEVSSESNVNTYAFSTGVSGNITIETGQLFVRDQSFIDTSNQANGRGGNLTVIASESVDIDGSGRISQLSTTTETGNKMAGNLTVKTGSLILHDGGQITSSSFSGGNGGTVNIYASKLIEISGKGIPNLENLSYILPSGIFSSTTGEKTLGDGGNISINTGHLIVKDGGAISVAADEGSMGRAGTLVIDATESVIVSGTDSRLLAKSESAKPAGDLTISTDRLTVQNGAEISVSGEGEGPAGNLIIKANSVFLNKAGSIQASTISGQGGNIQLESENTLLLRRNSLISAEAGGTGDGGNINVDAGVVAAIPKEDSDIITTAGEGNGGDIQINAQRIFGIEPRQEPSPLSGIDASSDLGVDGTVDIQTLTIDPSQGLLPLPAVPVDPSRLIAQGCSVRKGATTRKLSEFVVTGRGGVPASPYEALSSDAVLTNWVEPESQSSQVEEGSQAAAQTTPDDSATTKPSPEIVEAQGWITTPDGKVMLVAQMPTATPHSSGLAQPPCPGS